MKTLIERTNETQVLEGIVGILGFLNCLYLTIKKIGKDYNSSTEINVIHYWAYLTIFAQSFNGFIWFCVSFNLYGRSFPCEYVLY